MAKRFRTVELSNPGFEPTALRFATVKSENLKGRGDCTFFIPPSVESEKNVPVVILLHGVYGSHWAWTYAINVHIIATQLIREGKISPMVLVMPSDGLMGDGGGYFNHGEKNFEKWIVEDVVELIRQVIPQTGTKMKPFIAGLSMGGYGALRLMAKFPDKFSGASGLSSITCLTDLLPFLSPKEQRYFKLNFNEERLLTYIKKNQSKLPPFRFDCGKADSLFGSNQILHNQLTKLGIAHGYEELEGDHSNEYWNQNIDRTLIYFSDLAKKQEQ
jgi:putative tributyrin esterase